MSFSIETGKETGLVQTGVIPKPLILCQLAAVDGDTVYLCTTPSLGGATQVYGGNTYQARLQSNPIAQIQAMSPEGYDIPGSINLAIADGDFSIWTNHANAHGWRGGTLTVLFVLWDIPSNTYSTNSYLWTFILDKPNIDESGKLTVAAQARQSMTRLNVPNVPRQNRCTHNMPSTAAQRLDGLTNPTSLYAACGYSPDLISIGGVGNTTTANLTNPNGTLLTDSAGIYVSCDYTRSCGAGKGTLTQGCMARLGNYAGTLAADGDIEKDGGGRATARFDGDTWIAPVGWKGRQFVNPSAGVQYGFNATNPATGTTYYNQGYGTCWVDATVLEPAGDPNSTRVECIVCIAPNGPATIRKVVVNGVEVTGSNPDLVFTYYLRSAGGRQGAVNRDVIFDSQGDPHGGLCYIEIVVPVELVTSSAIPTVRVLLSFPQPIHAYPVATAVISGGNTILTLAAGVQNNFNDGITSGQKFNLVGNSGVPDGGYTAASVTTGTPGTITIVGTWAGTGGGVYYYPIAYADDAMIDSKGAAAANPVWALMDLLTWGPFTVLDFDIQTWYDASKVCETQITYLDINGASATHARYRCSFALTTGSRQSMAKAVLGLRNCAGMILGRNPSNGLLQCFIEQSLADQQPAPITGSNYNTPVSSLAADGTVTNGYLAYLFDGAGSIEKGTFKLGGRSLNDTPNTVAFPFQDSANGWVQDSITTIDENGYLTSGKQEIAAPLQILGIENFDQGMRCSNIELAKSMYGNSRFDAGGTELPSFRTTVKAAHLASRVGFICGIKYDQLGLTLVLARLLSATPQTDGEHWDLAFRWHYDRWNTDLYTQNPAPFQRNLLSGVPDRPPLPYRPARSAWLVDDALFAGLYTIGTYTTNGQISLFGVPPINSLSAVTAAPQVPLQATFAGGGSIAAGNYVLSLVSKDAAGRKSAASRLVSVPVTAGSSTITIPNIVWDSGAASYELYFGPDSLHMWKVGAGTVAASITITSVDADGSGQPDNATQRVKVIVTPIRHGGIFGAAATAIATNAITIPSTPTLNQWAGRVLALYGSAKVIASGGIGNATYDGLCFARPANLNVTANTTAGVMTVTQSTLLGGLPFTYAGDAYVMRAMANIASANTIGDAGFVNSFAPGGLGTNAEFGKVVWIIAGTGAGQRRNIIANTSTTCTIGGTWDTTPDGTSVFVILEPSPCVTIDTSTYSSDGISVSDALLAAIRLPLAGPAGVSSYLVQVVTEDANGNISPVAYAPWQEVYVPPASSSAVADGYYPSITPAAGHATVDLANGLNQVLVLNGTAVTIDAPIFTGSLPAAGDWFVLYLRQDATGSRAMPTFTHAAGAFVSNTAAVIALAPDLGTDTPVTFTFRDGFWIPDLPGAATS